MTKERLTLEAAPREGSAKGIRREERVPAVLYGHGLDTTSISVDGKAFGRLLSKAGTTSLVTLSVGKQEHPVLIRDIQYHPVSYAVQHIDFYQVRLDEKVTADVSLRFEGEAPAVKDLGGVFLRNSDTISVQAFPQDLPHDIEVSISSLTSFDATITVADLAIPDGVEVLDDADSIVALVQAPRTEAELEALAEEVTEDVEEVEGVKKEEPAEGEEASADAPEEKTEDS